MIIIRKAYNRVHDLTESHIPFSVIYHERGGGCLSICASETLMKEPFLYLHFLYMKAA